MFIGWDFEHIGQYKELQVSPQGEWVDLDINRDAPRMAEGMKWNSGYSVKARVDGAARTWYGEMRIPFSAIDTRPTRPGLEFRIGLYRIAGTGEKKHYAWSPTGRPISTCRRPSACCGWKKPFPGPRARGFLPR